MEALEKLYTRILERKTKPVENSYTNYLYDKGVEKICKKVGEESTEVVIAAIRDDKEDLVNEIADLTYHILVLMADRGLGLEDLEKVLENRSKKEGNSKGDRKEVKDI